MSDNRDLVAARIVRDSVLALAAAIIWAHLDPDEYEDERERIQAASDLASDLYAEQCGPAEGAP